MATSNPTTNDADADAGGVTGPHYGLDAQGNGYDYYRCEGCGLESSDPGMDSNGCPRCNGGSQA